MVCIGLPVCIMRAAGRRIDVFIAATVNKTFTARRYSPVSIVAFRGSFVISLATN